MPIISFCQENSLNFVSCSIKLDEETQKKIYLPVEVGYRDFDFKKSLEVLQAKGEKDCFLIGLQKKFIVIDTDTPRATEFMDECLEKLNIKPFKTESPSNVFFNKKGKFHYWFKNPFGEVKNILKWNNNDIDIITDTISEVKTTELDYDSMPELPNVLYNVFYKFNEKILNEKERKSPKPKEQFTEDKIKDLVRLLADFRTVGFNEWRDVGFCLKNLGEFYNIFDEFSRRCPSKYNSGKCLKFWNGIKDNTENKLGLGSLIFWVNLDNPDGLKKWYDKYHKAIKEIDFIDEPQVENSRKYEDVKKEFEKTHFKVMHPLVYCSETEEEVIRIPKKTFRDTYENYHYQVIKQDKKGHSQLVDKEFVPDWMKDEKIRTYEKIDFLPKVQHPENIYNVFNGFEIEKKKEVETKKTLENSIIFKHLKNICNGDEKIFNYVVKWLANRIQKPSEIPNTSIVFRSIEGTGKNMFFDWFGRQIIGSDYYTCTKKLDKAFGNFNSLLSKKILFVINELTPVESYQHMDTIKDCITAEYNIINPKNLTEYKEKNNCGFIFFTNNFNVLNIAETDRRFVLIEIDNIDYMKEPDYFKNLLKEIKSGEIDKLFYEYLLKQDLSNFDFKEERPITNYYKQLQELNRPVLMDYFINIYEENQGEKEISFKASEIYGFFNNFCQSGGYKTSYTQKRLSVELKRYGDFVKDKRKVDGIYYYFNMTNLKTFLMSKGYITDFIDEEVPEVKPQKKNIVHL